MFWLDFLKISIGVKRIYLLLSHIILKNCYVELLSHKGLDKRHTIKSPLVLSLAHWNYTTTKCPFIFIIVGICLEQMRKLGVSSGPWPDRGHLLLSLPSACAMCRFYSGEEFSPPSTRSVPSSPTWSECEEVHAGSGIKTLRFSCL